MRRMIALSAIACSLLVVGRASAQEAAAPEAAEASTEVPQLGVLPELDRGFFIDVDGGVFFALNPAGASTGTRSITNAQPRFGFALGFDLSDRVVAGAGMAYESSAGSCFSVVGGLCGGADNFSIFAVNAFAGYLHPLSHQWYVGGKVIGGLALMSPAPAVPEGADPGLTTGFNGGVVFSTEYHTHLKHFVVGLDAGAQYVSGGGVGLVGFYAAPRIKYVF